MEVRGGELKIDALLMHEPLQNCSAFIIHHLEERAEAEVTEVGVEDLMGMTKFLRAARLKGFDQYGIAVIFKEEHKAFADEAGSHSEAASLVR